MKKTLLLVAIIITITLKVPISTQAQQNNNDNQLPKAGLTPRSILYKADRLFENLSLKLTFNEEKKAEKLANYAEERLAELSRLDTSSANKYGDQLFNDYGIMLEKANLLVAKLTTDEQISEEKIGQLQSKIDIAQEKQVNVSDRISKDIKEIVNKSIEDAKLSMFIKFSNIEEAKNLHNRGFDYGDILTLQAISELTGKTIEEIISIKEVVARNEKNDIEIDIEPLLEGHGLSDEQVTTKLVEYRNSVRQDMREAIDTLIEESQKRQKEILSKIYSHLNTSPLREH
jgi:Domain of unknown function (DUF5667)